MSAAPYREPRAVASAAPIAFLTLRFGRAANHDWQGQGDSNPRPSVLETDALPAELYPYAAREIATGMGARKGSGFASRRNAEPMSARFVLC